MKSINKDIIQIGSERYLYIAAKQKTLKVPVLMLKLHRDTEKGKD
jgi:hypothetical protein